MSVFTSALTSFLIFSREDGKDCLKFYTDPGYFFELWYSEIKKDIDQKRKELKEKRDKRGRVWSLLTVLIVLNLLNICTHSERNQLIIIKENSW